MSEARATGEYEGHEFYVDHYWRFCLPENGKEYKTYDELKTAVDNVNKAKKSASRRKMSQRAVNQSGESVEITGVHAGHGHIVTKPPLDRYHNTIYPHVPWIIEALKEQKSLEERAGHIERALEPFKIDHALTYRRGGFDSSHFDERVREVETEIVNKTKAAEKTTFDKAFQNARPKRRIHL